jgi:transposase
VDAVKERMRTEGRPWVRQHWSISYNGLVAPRKAEEIARPTGVSATTVHRVIARYNRQGPAAIDQSTKGGRHHQYLTLEQEQAFLQPFFARAERGEIATAQTIQQAYETLVKHTVHMSSISRLLHRHGWRKLVPRPRHPKANPEEQAAFQKKTFSRRSKQAWPAEIPAMSDRS